jgi:hypothetical protein
MSHRMQPSRSFDPSALTASSAVPTLSAEEKEVCRFLDAQKMMKKIKEVQEKLLLMPGHPGMSFSQFSLMCTRLKGWPVEHLWSFAVHCIDNTSKRSGPEVGRGFNQRIKVALSTTVAVEDRVCRSSNFEYVPFKEFLTSIRYMDAIDAWCVADVCVTIAMRRPETWTAHSNSNAPVNADHLMLIQCYLTE